jgi:arylsulfatase A-like enzyme
MAMLPLFMVAVPQVYPLDGFILALGIAVWLVPWFKRRAANPGLVLRRSLPVLIGSVIMLAGSVAVSDWLKQRREAARALPSADCPNVLLVVLDTVRADRLSLYGYERATTPNLERLARRGIRFDAARATAPWTLPSHASFFTGRWPHELGVEWLTPLRSNYPMLAEYLASQGYATVGIVGNAGYCSYETGLGRGFTYYDDYRLVRLGFLRMAVLVDKLLLKLLRFDLRYHGDPPWSLRHFLEHWFYSGQRRDAGSINRAFLDWLARRPQTGRPFFAFLNYIDAHTPYRLPEEARPRFGLQPLTEDERQIVYDNWVSLDKLALPQFYVAVARDAYDNCIAYEDEQLGTLVGELERRELLENTWVVILSDHGEGLGEHGLFDHGQSLYSTEIRVPLLVLPPGKPRAERRVSATVSLRDLPATIVDLVGLEGGAPFPGRSLARFWQGLSPEAVPPGTEGAVSELRSPSPNDPNQGRSPARRGPLLSMALGNYVYIRNEADGSEELFNQFDDPRELTNRARLGALNPVLEQFRASLKLLKPAEVRTGQQKAALKD